MNTTEGTTVPTTIDEALDAIAAVRAAFTAEPDLIERIGADDPDAFAFASDLLDREDQAFTVASDLIVARLGVPVGQHDQAHAEVNDGLAGAARLDGLGVAVDEYRDRRSDEAVEAAIEDVAATLGRSSHVNPSTARYVIAGLRAVVEQGRSAPGDGFNFDARFDHHYRETNITPIARAS